MKRYNGGTQVEGGYYWNVSKWSISAISGDSGTLEGGKEMHYLRMPLLVMVPVAALLGLSYVIFLPLIGFALALYAAGKKLGLLGKTALEQAAQTVAPTWRPGEAHFADGDDPKPGKAGNPEPSLDNLRKEIQQLRKDGQEHPKG